MRTVVPVRSFVGLLVCASTASAQLPPIIPVPTTRTAMSTGTPQDGATVVGNFDGNLIADAVSIVGGQLVFTHDLQLDRSVVSLGISANDVAACRNTASGDLFVSVGASGLVVGRWDNGLTLSGSNWAGLVSEVVTTDSAWSLAQRVRCGDFDGDGDSDIAALTADGLRILTAFATPAGWSFGTQHALAQAAHGISEVTPTVGSRQALTCVGVAGCQTFYLDTGTSISSVLPTGNYRDVVELVTPTSAWIVGLKAPVLLANSAWSQSLVLVAGYGASYSLELGPLDAVSVGVGNVNPDGYPDLVLNSRLIGDLLLLINTASPVTPVTASDPAWMRILVANDQLATASSTRSARVNVLDIDNDVDGDIVFTDGPTGSLTQLENPMSEDPNYPVDLPDPTAFGYKGNAIEVFDTHNSVVGLQFGVRFTIQSSPGFSHLEVVLWRQVGSGPFDPDPVLVQSIEYQQQQSGTWVDTYSLFQIPETTLPIEGVTYVLRMRQILPAESGEGIDLASPATMYDCTFEDLKVIAGGSTPISGGGVTPRPGGGGSGGPMTP